MRKILLTIFLFIMFIPFYVNAKVCDTSKITIESITLKSKSDTVEELNEASAKGKNIKLDLRMSEVGDNAFYKVLIKNDSSEDYELDNTSLGLNSDYVDYILEIDDESKIIKANSSKEVGLKVVYKNKVPDELFEDEKYNFDIVNTVVLSNHDNIVDNPKTGVNLFLFLITLLLILLLCLYVSVGKKSSVNLLLIIIGLTIIIPIEVYALCKCEISLELKVQILDPPINSVSFAEDSWDIIARVAKKKDVCSYYSVGDTKTINLDNYGTYEIRVSNCSKPVECNDETFSQTACGLVIEFSDIVTTHRMNPYDSDSTEIGNGCYGSWPASEMRAFLNNDFYNSLPNDLKNVIVKTRVVTGRGCTDEEDIFVSNDKLYLLNYKEVADYNQVDTAVTLTRQLDYYASHDFNSKIKKYNNTNYYWWLRTPPSSHCGPSGFMSVGDTGGWYYRTSTQEFGVSPAFKVG